LTGVGNGTPLHVLVVALRGGGLRRSTVLNPDQLKT
jgi:hypothetical protein